MNVTMRVTIAAAVLAAGSLAACTSPPAKDGAAPPREQTTVRETQKYKPTGSHIVERGDSGRKSPKNSSSAPVQDLSKSPAATIIPNQAPK
jgi:hypothetical protein